MSHVKMMAAAQPFLSGAISKTVNLPNEATVDEVQQIYEEGWRLGLKAVALYRDGCKASQPLSPSSDEATEEGRDDEPRRCAQVGSDAARRPSPSTRPKGARVRLPKKRRGFTQEARVGGHKIFLRTGEYEDGTLGEIFIDMHKEGAAFRSLMNCFAMAVSVGLQYGVPLETYVEQYTFTRFEPQGIVEGHDEHEVRDVDRRLPLPRPRRRVPAALRLRARAARRTRRDARSRPTPTSRRSSRRRRSLALALRAERATATRRPRERARRAARGDDGRRARLRRLRAHHGAQRRLLQVPELRKLDGLLLTSVANLLPL